MARLAQAATSKRAEPSSRTWFRFQAATACFSKRMTDLPSFTALTDLTFMASHIDGHEPWDLLVVAARDASFAIMPVGCPVCVPSIEVAEHLPVELAQDGSVQVVSTGEELLAVIRAG